MSCDEKPSEASFLDKMMSRHSPLLGDTGVQRIRKATVAHAGLGGVGALALELMVRAGVGRFRLLDRDRFETSNLNRQVFATVDSIGRPKVDVAAERIAKINPFAVVEKSFFEPVSVTNAEQMLDGADILMLCTDSPSSQIIFAQAARKMRVRLIQGSAPAHSACVWATPYDVPDSRSNAGSRLLAWMRRARGYNEIHDCSVREALERDVLFFSRPDGTFTPSIPYTPNLSACLMATLAVNYLSGLDTKPHCFRMNLLTFRPDSQLRRRYAHVKHLLMGKPQ